VIDRRSDGRVVVVGLARRPDADSPTRFGGPMVFDRFWVELVPDATGPRWKDIDFVVEHNVGR
jgi:hypothetical protein